MKEKFWLILFLGFSFQYCQAQETITCTGRVTDSHTREGLPGASISLPDIRRSAVADAQGNFQFEKIQPGRYLMQVSFVGYRSFVETVELGKNPLQISLDSAILENETVTVTGVSSATSTKRTPSPVSILKKEDLFRNIATNLIDNISKTPGVSQVATGPAISKPFIRGLGYNRVLVVNDGMRQEGQQWGDEHGIEIDEQNVSKVEVLKGPASLMYGSDALAGVINILSFTPPAEGTIKGNLSSSYLSNNRQRSLHADIGGNKNGFVWGMDGSYKAAADYRNAYDGYVFNSRFHESDFGMYTGLNRRWGFAHIYYTHFDQTLGLIEGDRDSATGQFLKRINDNGTEAEVIPTHADFVSIHPDIPRQRIRHDKWVSDNSFQIGKDRLTLVLGYQRNQRQEFGNVLDPAEKNLWFDLGTFNYSLQYHFAEQRNWKTTMGVNGMRQQNTNKGLEVLIPEYHFFDAGLFVYTQKKADKLTWSGGIRADNRSLQSFGLKDGSQSIFTAFKKNFFNLSGSAGLSYAASKKLTLKLNSARGFRAPGIPELASNGAHEGTNRFEYGEQNLKSETSWQTDAGLELSGEHVSLNLGLFYNALQHFIYYRKLTAMAGGDSLLTDNGNTFYAFRYDQQNASLYGAEMNLDIHPHPLDWLHFENSLSVVRGLLQTAQDGSRNLPFIPSARLINDLKVELWKKGKTVRNLVIQAELDNNFAQNHPFTGYNTETATPGYSLLNAGVGGEIRSKNKTLFTFYTGVNNITDKAYQNNLSRLKYTAENLVTGRMGVFNMGRTVSVKVNVPIGF